MRIPFVRPLTTSELNRKTKSKIWGLNQLGISLEAQSMVFAEQWDRRTSRFVTGRPTVDVSWRPPCQSSWFDHANMRCRPCAVTRWVERCWTRKSRKKWLSHLVWLISIRFFFMLDIYIIWTLITMKNISYSMIKIYIVVY